MEKKTRSALGAMVIGGGAAVAVLVLACNTLPLFGPPLACIAGELANGAIEDPLVIVADCAGATIAAIIQAIELELASPPVEPDAGDAQSVPGAVPSAAPGTIPAFPGAQRQAYEAHLRRILARAKALQAQGVK